MAATTCWLGFFLKHKNMEIISEYQNLFEHMINEHNLILLQSEMDEIILLSEEFLKKNLNDSKKESGRKKKRKRD